MFFKVLSAIIAERLQTQAIQAVDNAKMGEMGYLTSTLMRIAKFKSHKILCRRLQEEMCTLEQCENCVVLFDDPSTRQLFTIAYAEDDDFLATSANIIKISEEKLKKQQLKKEGAQYKSEVKAISQMKEEMHMELAVRDLILNRNQMICIPYQVGATGCAFAKSKTVYLNQFDGKNNALFVSESDNIKALPNVRNFLILPIVGHDGQPNGIIQMYNFKNSLTRLRVNRFIAMKRFLGGCLDTVALKTGLLECFMGL